MKRIEYEVSACPFCGSAKAPTVTTAMQSGQCVAFEIEDDCPCFGLDEGCEVWLVVCDITKGGCGASSGYRLSEGEAANDWNKRYVATAPKDDTAPEAESEAEA